MTGWLRTALVTIVIALASCVTINVYFPAAAAEKAADRIIEDVWGKEGQPPAPPKTGNEQSMLQQPDGLPRALLAWSRGAAELVIPTAAAQADLNVTSPAIRQLTGSMEARHAQLERHYSSGAVGLTPDGMVELRDPNAVPLPERTVVRKLVADENADRAALYAEIARTNGHPEWEADIRATFGQRWVAKARSGWWYRNAAGQWTQK
jgi:uncharacterized protein YdbL (DUF1318 family)